MKRTTMILAILAGLAAYGYAAAQLAPDPFRYDVKSFFAGPNGRTWVGETSMFNAHYTDTVHVHYDPEQNELFLRRVLVDDDKTKIVSNGVGLISLGANDSVFTVWWTEKSYPEATGRMFWDAEYGHWRINFGGEWKQWFINIRNLGDGAFEAGVARKVGSFPAVELLDATYRVIDD